jgi:hypothetical protein
LTYLSKKINYIPILNVAESRNSSYSYEELSWKEFADKIVLFTKISSLNWYFIAVIGLNIAKMRKSNIFLSYYIYYFS